MYWHKLFILVIAIVAVSSATIESSEDLQEEQMNLVHTRQKRAPFLLKKALLGGLIAKKALILGGGAGLLGGGLVGAALSHKLSEGEKGIPVYINNSPPIYSNRPAVHYDYAPPIPQARPPIYFDQSPPLVPSYPVRPPVYNVQYQPVYENSGYPPAGPPYKVDCY